jgi:hypothetical protein
MNNIVMQLPSRHYCETGLFDLDERYDQNIHSGHNGKTPYERCGYYGYYGDEYNDKRAAYGAGTKKSRKNRRRTRKSRRKSSRRRYRHRR